MQFSTKTTVLALCCLVLSACTAQQDPETAKRELAAKAETERKEALHQAYVAMLEKHAGLVPVFDGMFIVRDSTDSVARGEIYEHIFMGRVKRRNVLELSDYDAFEDFSKLYPSYKLSQGVVDSTGRVVVPFVSDRLRMISDSAGEVLIYSGKIPLPTGVPRSRFSFVSIPFDKKGLRMKDMEVINITAIDWGRESVIPWPW